MAGANGGRRIPRRRLLAGGAVAGVAAAGGGVAAWLGMRSGSDPVSRSPTPFRTPTPTNTVVATASPTRTPSATATPSPAPGPGLITETNGEWIVQGFAPGEAIEFNPGICLMEPDGNVTCYLFARASREPGDHICDDSNRWVVREANAGAGILDRRTGRQFSYPNPRQGLVLASEDYLVFGAASLTEGRISPPNGAGPYFVVDSEMQPVSEFEFPDLDDRFPQQVWKRGPDTFAYVADRVALRRVDLASGAVATLFEPPPLQGYSIRPDRIQWQPGTQVAVYYWYVPDHAWDDAGRPRPEFPFRNKLVVLDPDGVTLDYVSDWADGPLHLSPDGSWIAIESQLHQGNANSVVDHWPVVAIHDARSGAPIFRIRSVAISSGDFLTDNRWLADSSGVVATRRRPGDHDTIVWRALQYAVLGRDATMSTLPASPGADAEWFRSPRNAGPVPAPSDTDLLSYGRVMLLRRSTGWFAAPAVPGDGPIHLSPWGRADAAEMRFGFAHGGHGGPGGRVLLPPKLEYPPFDDSLRVRVAVSGTCLNLREAPSLEASVIDCLDGATPLTLEPEPGDFSGESPVRPLGGALAHYNWQENQSFARVVTDGGMAGWVALEYLDWA